MREAFPVRLALVEVNGAAALGKHTVQLAAASPAMLPEHKPGCIAAAA